MAVAGDWYNEFGSHMRLESDSAGGISGTYLSAVGEVAGEYAFTGRCGQVEETARGVALGWAVAWRNERNDAASVTTWSGQYLPDEERIFTTWLLTRSTDAGDAWEATTVGQDVFTRRKPTVEDIERSFRSGRPISHPKTRS